MRVPRIFYGWWIVTAGVLLSLLQGSFYLYGFGVLYIPLLRALGTTRAALGGAIGLSRLQGGLIAPLAGWLIDRHGPRRIMFVGLAIMGVGWFAFSMINSLLMLYVIFIVMSAASSLGSTRPITVAVANWFIRKRGRAMGIFFAGFGVGGSFGGALAWLINSYGWRTSAVIAGLCFWIIGFPLAGMLRHRPEDMGLLPDGATPASREVTNPTGEEREPVAPALREEEPMEPEFTPGQALRTRAFWMLAIAYGGWSTVVTVSHTYQIPYLTEEIGAPFVTAAFVASLYPLVSIPGRIGFGWMADYVNMRYLLSVLFLLQALGLVILVQIHSLAWAPAYLIVLAPSYGGSIPVRTAVVAYFFGRRNFGTISGLLQIVDLPGAVLGPVFVGWVFDSLGTYRPGFLVIAALMALGAAALLLAKRPQLQTQPSARETSSPTAPYQGVVGAPPVPPAGGSSGPLS